MMVRASQPDAERKVIPRLDDVLGRVDISWGSHSMLIIYTPFACSREGIGFRKLTMLGRHGNFFVE